MAIITRHTYLVIVAAASYNVASDIIIVTAIALDIVIEIAYLLYSHPDCSFLFLGLLAHQLLCNFLYSHPSSYNPDNIIMLERVTADTLATADSHTAIIDYIIIVNCSLTHHSHHIHSLPSFHSHLSNSYYNPHLLRQG